MKATDFTIWFVGFVTQLVLFNGTHRAVLVENEHGMHDPFLIVDASSIVKAKTTYEYTEVDGVATFDIDQDRLTVAGTDDPPRLTKSYIRHVTPLSAIASGKPSSKVHSGFVFKHADAYVDYSGGCLSVPAVHERKVTFDDNDWPGEHCMAKAVQYTEPMPDEVVITGTKGQSTNKNKIVLTKNAAVLVINGYPGSVHSFSDFNWILDGTTFSAMRKLNKKDCALVVDSKPCVGGAVFDLAPFQAGLQTMSRSKTHAAAHRQPLAMTSAAAAHYMFIVDVECTNTRFP